MVVISKPCIFFSSIQARDDETLFTPQVKSVVSSLSCLLFTPPIQLWEDAVPAREQEEGLPTKTSFKYLAALLAVFDHIASRISLFLASPLSSILKSGREWKTLIVWWFLGTLSLLTFGELFLIGILNLTAYDNLRQRATKHPKDRSWGKCWDLLNFYRIPES